VGALEPGQPFPDITVEGLEGQIRLSERWASGPLVVAFMRHFG
jgi:hypothetical protein